MNSINIIVNIGVFSIVIPIIMGLSSLRLLKVNEKIVLIFLVLIFLFDILQISTTQNGNRNLIYFNVFTHIEYVILSVFYILTFKKYYSNKILIIVYSILYIPIFMQLIYSNYFSFIDNNSVGVVSIIFIVSSTILIFKSQFTTTELNSLSITTRIINYTVLFNFATTLIVFLLINWIIINEYGFFANIWIINSLTSIITNILFTLALWKARTQTK